MCINGKITEDALKSTSKKFRKSVEYISGLASVLDIGTEVEDCPRLCYQASITSTLVSQTHAAYLKPHVQAPEVATKGNQARVYSDTRRTSTSPQRWRTKTDATRHGGRGVIDAFLVTHCVMTPQGMQTMEVVPNSLQKQRAYTINVVNSLRENAQAKHEAERALM